MKLIPRKIELQIYLPRCRWKRSASTQFSKNLNPISTPISRYQSISVSLISYPLLQLIFQPKSQFKKIKNHWFCGKWIEDFKKRLHKLWHKEKNVWTLKHPYIIMRLKKMNIWVKIEPIENEGSHVSAMCMEIGESNGYAKYYHCAMRSKINLC